MAKWNANVCRMNEKHICTIYSTCKKEIHVYIIYEPHNFRKDDTSTLRHLLNDLISGIIFKWNILDFLTFSRDRTKVQNQNLTCTVSLSEQNGHVRYCLRFASVAQSFPLDSLGNFQLQGQKGSMLKIQTYFKSDFNGFPPLNSLWNYSLYFLDRF